MTLQTNRADPGHTTSEEAVWSRSSLFALYVDKHFVNSSTDNQHFL